MAKYVPSGKVSLPGLLLVLGVGGGLGWVIGAVMGFFSGLIWIFWVFPIAWGIALAVGIALGIHVGKCRSRRIAVIAALVCSTLSYGALHRTKNWDFRNDLEAALLKNGRATKETVDDVIEKTVRQETGKTGFWGLLEMRAKKGLFIPSRSVRKTPALWGLGAYLYWLLECAIGTGMAIYAGIFFSNSPFCESCHAWFKREDDWGIRPWKGEALRGALERKDFSHLAGFLVHETGAKGFSLERCTKCTGGPICVKFDPARWAEPDPPRKSAASFDEMLAGEEARSFLAALPALRSPGEGTKQGK